MERKLIAVAVSSALALPMAAQAVEFSAYGQVARAIISVDGTGEDSDGDLQHVEGAASSSRFGVRGSEELENGMTIGTNAEWGIDGYSLRQSHVYLSTAGGKLTVGHGSTAADGMAHADLSGGPSFLGGATPYCAWAGEGVACSTNDGSRASVLRYDTPAIGPASIAISAGNDDYWDVKLTIAGSMGDAGYDLRIGHIGERDRNVTTMMAATEDSQMLSRVDGAELLGVLQEEFADQTESGEPGEDLFNQDGEPLDTVPVSDAQDALDAHGGDDADNIDFDRLDSEANLEDAAFLKSVTTPGSAASSTSKEEKRGDVTTASAAFSFGQGTSVALAWSQDNSADNDYQYIKLDHSYGDGSVAVYYKTAEEAGVDGSMVGVALGHNIGGGATAFAGYRRLSEDNAEDVDLLVAGLRVTFN